MTNPFRPRTLGPFWKLSRLRRMKGSEQVAAVCYRVRKGRIEFLLVNTRGGRWIFPKGAIESGLSHAQAAALEAFEEAGVHGRIEEACFAHYIHHKGNAEGKSGKELQVRAHLCQVTRRGRPKESHRHPTWFPVEKARRRLERKRGPEGATELLRVLDLAVARIPRFEQALVEARPEVRLPVAPAGRLVHDLSFRRSELRAANRILKGVPRLLRLPLLKGTQSGSGEGPKIVELVTIANPEDIAAAMPGRPARAPHKNKLGS